MTNKVVLHTIENIMNIEKYNKEHNIEEILFIDKQSVEDFFDDIKSVYSQNDLLDISKNYFEKSGNMFIGLLNNEIIAMCGYIPKSKNSAQLQRLRVRKDLRGKGYGKQILRHVEEKISKSGYSKIEFSTAALRENTIHFYKKRKYKEVARAMYGNIQTVIFTKEI